jgi:uncharacterized membrane protein YfcA
MHFELIAIFFFIALIYSSVGFGGGSAYLAILALYELHYTEIRIVALICNVIVVTGGVITFVKHKQILWNRILPLIILSIPAAFLGAILKLKEDFYFILLGISLIMAAILLWIKPIAINSARKKSDLKDCVYGGAIGFLAGMVGIGGGIFLSPVLNLSGWGSAKQIAAAASVFILVNSLSGIAGQIILTPEIDITMIIILGATVLTGGLIGSNIGMVKFNLVTIRRVTGVIVLVAGIQVLIKHIYLF